MDQLLSIKHIPIKIEVNVTNAQLKPREEDPLSPSVRISRSPAGIKVAAQPCKVDFSSPRTDSYVPTPVQSNTLRLTYEGAAKLGNAEEGTGTAVAVSAASQSIDTILSRISQAGGNNFNYHDGTLSINYSMANSGGSDDVGSLEDLKNGFEFIPGDIEFIVSQMPELEIEYLGDPIYFPRSADPNYKGEVDLIV